MLIKVVGCQDQDYTLDNGYHFTGRKVHVIDLDSKAPNQSGNLVMTFKIPADHRLANVPLEIGKFYDVYFNVKGQPDYLAPADK